MHRPIFSLGVLFLFIFSASISAQEAVRIYQNVDQMPYFAGCSELRDYSTEKRQCSNQTLISFISDNIIYPEEAKSSGIEGVILASFIVDARGKVVKPTILKDIGGGCGSEALRIISLMPDWEPGKINEKKVAVKLKLPVHFYFKEDINQSKGYTIIWGALNQLEISKKELKDNLENPLKVIDPNGEEIHFSGLTFSYERNGKIFYANSKGNINEKIKKLIKKRVRKKGSISITAVAPLEGHFVEIERQFVISN